MKTNRCCSQFDRKRNVYRSKIFVNKNCRESKAHECMTPTMPFTRGFTNFSYNIL